MTAGDGSVTRGRTDATSYYGRPILKEPVWKTEIPLYLFAGGVAGASSVLGLGARLVGNQKLAKATTYIGLAAELVSPALLIADLGRPERFLKMLRVFKVTSPMSVGSWILAGSGAATVAEAACEALDVFPRLRYVPAVAGAALGGPLATYTGALLSDTAIPVWHEARRELPFAFAASAAASAGAAATLVLGPRDAGPARRLAVGGAAAANVAAWAMRRRLGFLAEPYREGVAGALDKVSRAATLAGSALLARPARDSRAAAVAGSALVLGGELALRFSVFEAGFQSARNPDYVVRAQRGGTASR